MTISNTNSRVVYEGNGSATVFDITFPYFSDSKNLYVYHRAADGAQTLLTEDTDYSVDTSADTVTYPLSGDPLPSGEYLAILRDLPAIQELDLVNNDPFDANLVEQALDRTTMLAQQTEEKIDRAMVYSESTPSEEVLDAGEFDAQMQSYADDAESARDTAVTYRDEAYDWAEADVDVDVSDTAGHSGNSAYHHSDVARRYANEDQGVEVEPGYYSSKHFMKETSDLLDQELEKVWWHKESSAVAYASSSTFTVTGDKTGVYVEYRAVRLTQDADATGHVLSSSYDSGADETTVEVNCTVDSGLSEVEYGQIPDSSPLTPPIYPPSNTAPSDGATAVEGPNITLKTSGYFSLYGRSQQDSRWQVSNVSDFSSTVIDTYAGAATQYTFEASESTTYYWRVKFQDSKGQWSKWSEPTTFTTEDSFATVYGIALVSTGGGAGDWQNVDANGDNIDLSTTDFDNHTIWKNIEDVTIDGQEMVKIPKFWIKTGTAPSGSDQAGNKCWWISDWPVEGFEVHPAFMDGGVEIDQVYVGKYEGIDDGTNGSGNNIVGSASGASPLVNTTFTDYKQYCANRNEANGGNTGVEGFHLWTCYEMAAIQLLALIELETPDVQSAIASGRVNSSSAANTGSTDAVWRGINELWGNVWHWTDGAQFDSSHQVQVWDTNGNQNLISTGVNITSSDGWGVTLHDESGTDWDLSLLFLPKTTDGTEGNGTLADYLWASEGEQNVVRHGGPWSDGSRAGVFALHLRRAASESGGLNGGRLAKW